MIENETQRAAVKEAPRTQRVALFELRNAASRKDLFDVEWALDRQAARIDKIVCAALGLTILKAKKETGPKLTDAECSRIHREAHLAGMAAGKAAMPTPMIVSEVDIFDKPLDDAKSWFVSEGVCGFAWIIVRPANSRFANWGKKNEIGRHDDYAGGFSIWVHEFNQSHTRKCAYAGAYANVLCKHGIRAYMQERLD